MNQFRLPEAFLDRTVRDTYNVKTFKYSTDYELALYNKPNIKRDDLQLHKQHDFYISFTLRMIDFYLPINSDHLDV